MAKGAGYHKKNDKKMTKDKMKQAMFESGTGKRPKKSK